MLEQFPKLACFALSDFEVYDITDLHHLEFDTLGEPIPVSNTLARSSLNDLQTELGTILSTQSPGLVWHIRRFPTDIQDASRVARCRETLYEWMLQKGMSSDSKRCGGQVLPDGIYNLFCNIDKEAKGVKSEYFRPMVVDQVPN